MKTLLAIIALTFTLFLAGCPKGDDPTTTTPPPAADNGVDTSETETDQ